nr:MAG TPA: transport protein [Caudoviricetes sp.]
MMTYKEIFDMVAVTAYNRFPKGFNYEGLQNCIVENATKIYIEQMRLEKEKLQQEYDDLYEGHDKLSYEWAKLKKENRELNKKYNELLEDFNRINSEPLLRKMTIAELKERGFLRNESK